MKIQEIERWARKIFLDAGLERELIHGLRHFEQVQREYQKICSLVPLDIEVGSLLEIAVNVHDIGRTVLGVHAENSARMFSEWSIPDLLLIQKHAVIFAIANHSHGLVGLGIKEAKTLEQKILGLLVICDHMDAASPEGAARAAMAYKGKPTLSNDISKSDLLRAMEVSPPFGEMGRYTASLLGNWVWDYAATGPIMQAIDSLVTVEYKRYVEDRLTAFRSLIDVALNCC